MSDRTAVCPDGRTDEYLTCHWSVDQNYGHGILSVCGRISRTLVEGIAQYEGKCENS